VALSTSYPTSIRPFSGLAFSLDLAGPEQLDRLITSPSFESEIDVRVIMETRRVPKLIREKMEETVFFIVRGQG
jgi:hypothetical protein